MDAALVSIRKASSSLFSALNYSEEIIEISPLQQTMKEIFEEFIEFQSDLLNSIPEIEFGVTESSSLLKLELKYRISIS